MGATIYAYHVTYAVMHNAYKKWVTNSMHYEIVNCTVTTLACKVNGNV